MIVLWTRNCSTYRL